MLSQPFFQVSLPIMITILGTVWALISTNNRRLDDIVSRLNRIEDRLTAIEKKVDLLEVRVWR